MHICLKEICFGYEPDTPILQDISAEFQPGRFYSIIGPNGSGKTTLLDLLSGFLYPNTGTITLDNRELGSFTRQVMAQNMALVSQDTAINFPFPVRDVIMMGRHPYISRFSQPSQTDMDRVESAMEACEIKHLESRKINSLSGGERQRCVFARAICQDTPVLLLDEAFSNMDISHTLHLLKLLKRLASKNNRLIISVFHDLNLASSWSDNLLLLKQGKIHSFGNSQDVLTRETIKSVFNVDSIVTFNTDTNRKQVCYPID